MVTSVVETPVPPVRTTTSRFFSLSARETVLLSIFASSGTSALSTTTPLAASIISWARSPDSSATCRLSLACRSYRLVLTVTTR